MPHPTDTSSTVITPGEYQSSEAMYHVCLRLRPPLLARFATMSQSPGSIPEYLQRVKADLPSLLEKGKITFVTGNQSADLDSMCSAILYAYLSTVSDAHQDSRSSKSNYVPLLHIPREDIEIRPEFTHLFKRVDIDADSLVTLSDLPSFDHIKEKLPSERTHWVLVDHNKLEGSLGEIYAERVTGAIDHHVDEHAVPADAEPRRIEVCGSCSSLVIDHMRDVWSKATANLHSAADAAVAQLGLAAILIDTKNMTDESKVRAVDKRSESYCEELLSGPNGLPDWDRDAFFLELDAAKRSVGDLPINGILRKDYKEWKERGVTLGISSVVKPLSFLAGKLCSGATQEPRSWSQVAEEFMRPRNLDIWAVMAAAVDPETQEFGRELYVQWRDDKTAGTVRYFEEHSTTELKLSPKRVDGIDAPSSKIWQQNDTTQTRKQVGPLLRDAILKQDQAAGSTKT